MAANLLSKSTLLTQVSSTSGVTITESASGTSTLQSNHQYQASARPTSSVAFPVVTLVPTTGKRAAGTTNGTPIALDLMPTGSGTHIGHSNSNGVAWIDVCDIASSGDSTDTFAGSTVRVGMDGVTSGQSGAYIASACYGNSGFCAGSSPLSFEVPTNTSGSRTPAVRMLQCTNGGPANADAYASWNLDPVVSIARHGGSIVLGSGYNLATTTTVGFVYLPQMAGAPTGVPPISNGGIYGKGWSASQAYSGFGAGHCAPIVIDITNSKIWVNISGTWKGVGVA